MADNVMNGDDPSVTMGVNLAFTNIEQSSAQLETLIGQTEDWRNSIEAVKTSLSDTFDILGNLTDATGSYRDAFQEVLDLSERHESILRRSVDNAQALAAATRGMSDMLSTGMGLGGVAPSLMGEVGRGMMSFGGPDSPTSGGIAEEEMGGGIVPLQVGGLPGAAVGPGRLRSAISNMLETAATNQYWMSNGLNGGSPTLAGTHYDVGDSEDDDLSWMKGGISTNGIVIKTKAGKQRVSTQVDTSQTSREAIVNGLLNVPYYMPGGRLAALARYVNKITYDKETKLGLVTGYLSKQKWLFGEEIEDPQGPERLQLAREERFQDLLLKRTQELKASTLEETLKKYGKTSLEELNPWLRGQVQAQIEDTTVTDTEAQLIREAAFKLDAKSLGIRMVTTSGGLLGSGGRIVNFLGRRVPGLRINSGWNEASTALVNRERTALLKSKYIELGMSEAEAQATIESMSARGVLGLDAAAAETYAAGAGLTEEALAAGLGTSAGAGIAAGGFAAAAATAAAAIAIPIIAYKGYGIMARMGREYSAATGEGDMGTAFARGVATRFNAFADSFLTGGLMDSKTAMEIRMGAEQAGFRRGSGYYSSFVTGAENVYQKYGIDPNEYMQMFQNSVINAKNSMLELNGSIQTLGRIASTSNTSFQILRQTYDYYTQSLYQAGMTGGATSAVAMAGATMYAGNPQMQGYGTSLGLLSTRSGQILTSMAAGTNPMDYFNIMRTPSGQAQMASATSDAVLNLLGIYGLTPGMPNMDNAIGYAQAQGLNEYIASLIPNPNGKPWTPDTVFQFVKGLLSGKGMISEQMPKNAADKLQDLAGGKGINPNSVTGVRNFFGNLRGVEDARSPWLRSLEEGFLNKSIPLLGDFFHRGDREVYRDKRINNGEVIWDYSSLSEREQRLLRQDLISGKAQMALGQETRLLGMHFDSIKSKWKTLGKATGGNILGNAAMIGSITVGLNPEAQRLLKIIGNPTAYQNASIRNNARTGYSSNTYQDPNAVSMGYDFGLS